MYLSYVLYVHMACSGTRSQWLRVCRKSANGCRLLGDESVGTTVVAPSLYALVLRLYLVIELLLHFGYERIHAIHGTS